jgi:hypothetical protein
VNQLLAKKRALNSNRAKALEGSWHGLCVEFSQTFSNASLRVTNLDKMRPRRVDKTVDDSIANLTHTKRHLDSKTSFDK